MNQSPKDLLKAKSWQQAVGAWLAAQGVSTILLLVLVYGMYRLTPVVLSEIQAGYDRNAEILKESAESDERTINRLLEHIEKR